MPNLIRSSHQLMHGHDTMAITHIRTLMILPGIILSIYRWTFTCIVFVSLSPIQVLIWTTSSHDVVPEGQQERNRQLSCLHHRRNIYMLTSTLLAFNLSLTIVHTTGDTPKPQPKKSESTGLTLVKQNCCRKEKKLKDLTFYGKFHCLLLSLILVMLSTNVRVCMYQPHSGKNFITGYLQLWFPSFLHCFTIF